MILRSKENSMVSFVESQIQFIMEGVLLHDLLISMVRAGVCPGALEAR